MSEPALLVVHAIDTEGPLGGDARRLPDGSAEFMDTWEAIVESLAELTAADARAAAADSYGDPWRFNWFILDFTGFRTNPKHRVAEYHDTYDHLKALPTELDGFYWHYHAPPTSGIGDQWAESWLESNEHNTILARRLLERGDFPAAYRAGGTIEDDAASAWLEHVFPLDFSNRVSERSYPDADLFHFNWHGAPAIWDSYHPAWDDFRRPGSMRRYVYRSLDLRSRYNEVTEATIEAALREVAAAGESRVLSFFSHDNRDMRPETYDVVAALNAASERTGVPWRSCTAVEAHRRFHGLAADDVTLRLEREGCDVRLTAEGDVFQRIPFVAAETVDGRFVRLHPRPNGPGAWRLRVPEARVARLGAAVSSRAGAVAVAV